MKAPPGQLDMFAAVEAAEAEAMLTATPRCMFNSPARGLAARAAEFAEWQDEYGNFGSLVRSHAWTIGMCVPGEPTARCQISVLHTDVRKHDWRSGEGMPDCTCASDLDELMYRGACRGCDWEGPPRPGENPAVEDACDHAWPGWRDLAVVPKWPGLKNDDKWWTKVAPLYPPGWVENGGPIRTHRAPHGTRHHGLHTTPYGGYDLAATKPDQEDKP